MAEDKLVAVLFAPGFEEIEALTVVDVLRRAGCTVTMAAVDRADLTVTGAHAISVGCDCALADLTAAELALVVLPGGMPGAANLAASAAVRKLVRKVWQDGNLVAAICAGPLALHAADLLVGKRVTAYPGVETQLPGAIYTGACVEIDDRIVTSKGVGTALEFALQLVQALGAPETAARLRKTMLVGDATVSN